VNEKRAGIYTCVCCGEPLFASDPKFDFMGPAGPSFYTHASSKARSTKHDDRSMVHKRRTEVRCAKCEAHLGHVFPDGPESDRVALLHQRLHAHLLPPKDGK
jgi:peptide-methionine (R)-S-oxide reductase